MSNSRMSDRRKREISLELTDALGEETFSGNPAVCAGYRGTNFNILLPWGKGPEFVVMPKTEEDVQKTLRIANKHRVSVMAICCGTFAPFSEADILLDMMGMNKIHKIDTRNSYVVVEPGVTFSTLLPLLVKEGFTIPYGSFPLTFSPVGNLTAMKGWNHNFGGRFCDQTLGLEVVTPEGELVRTSTATFGIDYWSRLTLSMSDIQGLFVPAMQLYPASGIITKAALRIWPIMESRALPITGFDSFAKGMEYSLRVTQAGIADQSMVWSWSLVGVSNARFGGPGEEFEIMNYLLDATTDYSKPYKDMDYCYNWTQFGGYREQVQGNVEVCRRIAKEVGGRVLEEEELQSTLPHIWQDWKDRYIDFNPRGDKKMLFASGTIDVWYHMGKVDDLVRLESDYNQRMKEKHNVRVMPYYTRVLEYGVSSALRYMVSSDGADREESERLLRVKTDMTDWVLQNYPDVHVDASPFRTIQNNSIGVGDLTRKIREVLDPNHIMYAPGEQRLEPEDAEGE